MLNLQIYRYSFLPESGACEKAQSAQGTAVIELSANDLPAVCPNASSPLWALHPRVFLNVVNEGEAMCPYCGTRYRLRRDAHVHDHEFGTVNLHQHRGRYDVNLDVKNRASTCCPPVNRANSQNLSADAFGNTTLELITRWLRDRR